MRIKVWGSRGSLPTPGPSTLRHGGNTTCLELRTREDRLIVVDAGTGLKRLGDAIMDEPALDDFCLVVTHAHWDHLFGFPFLAPAYDSRYTIRICGGPAAQASLEGYLKSQMAPPFFPVELSAMKAKFCFDCHTPGERCHYGVNVIPIPLSHPNGGYGYKFIEDGRSFVFLTDNELGHQHEGGLTRDEYVETCRGVDLLFHDAQYTDEEYQRTRRWGHSTFAEAVDLALAAGVPRLGLFHHDPDRSDDALDEMVEWCRERIRKQGGKLECFPASEGVEYQV